MSNSPVSQSFFRSLLSGKLFLRMLKSLVYIFIFLHIIIFVLLNYFFYNSTLHIIIEYAKVLLSNFTIHNISSNFGQLMSQLKSFIIIFFEFEKRVFIKSALVWFGIPLYLLILKYKIKPEADNKYIRGAKLLKTNELMKSIREKVALPFGENVFMPIPAEVKHTFIVGKPGSGKTNTINQIIENIKSRKKKAIVYDFKGDFVSKFYNPEIDKIFNPLDSRTVDWCIFNDVKTQMDINSLAASLIPESQKGDNPFWNNAARDIMAGILHYLYQNGKTTNADIWEAVTQTNTELAKMLKDTPGAEAGYKYLEDPKNKTAMDVISVFIQYAKCFDYMKHMKGGFSIEEWVNNGKEGILFITNYADLKDTLKPILSLFVDTVGKYILSLKDDETRQRRIFIILDEFSTLQKLSTMVNMLTLSRSKGGAIFLGIQNFGLIDDVYNAPTRQTIVNACGNCAVFSVADPETSDYCVRKLGEVEYWENQSSQSIGTNDADRINSNQVKRKEHLVLASDIHGLKDLTAYVRFSNYDVALTTFSYKKFKTISDSFIMRPDLFLSEFKKNALDNNLKNKDLDISQSPQINDLDQEIEFENPKDNKLDNSVDM